MIRYSTQPSKDAKAIITDSPTSEKVTTRDTKSLLDAGNENQNKNDLLDLDSADQDN